MGTLGGSSGEGLALNNLGQVVGLSTTTNDLATHGFLYASNAMVDLGILSSLDIDQMTRIKLEYDGNCLPGSGSASGPQEPALEKCSVKITVYAGCVIAHYKQGAYFQAVTQQQMPIAESDKSRKQAGSFKICAGTGAPAGAAATTPGLSSIAKIAIGALIIGGGVILPIVTNPSPSTP